MGGVDLLFLKPYLVEYNPKAIGGGIECTYHIPHTIEFSYDLVNIQRYFLKFDVTYTRGLPYKILVIRLKSGIRYFIREPP